MDNGLLVMKYPMMLTREQRDALSSLMEGVTAQLGCKVVICDGGSDATYTPPGMSELIAAITGQTEAINALAKSNEAMVNIIADDIGGGNDGMPTEL
jgi:hypothetical protein